MDPVFKSPPHAMHQVMQQRFAIHAIWFIAIPPYVLDLERNRHSFAMVRQITKMNFSINFVIFSNLRHHVTYYSTFPPRFPFIKIKGMFTFSIFPLYLHLHSVIQSWCMTS